MIRVIGFDGDDTLWHNEPLFTVTKQRLADLLAGHVGDPALLGERLYEREMANLRLFGYGIKGFTLSMVETAIEVTEGRVSAAEIQAIVDAGKAMIGHPIELLDGVEDVLRKLATDHRLLLITKGDLFDQESKIARSGLAGLFWRVEILAEKDEAAYRRILDRHGIAPDEFLMVGNSPRSDIAPATAVGASAVLIPYHDTWAHEFDSVLAPHHVLASMTELPALVQELASR